MDGDDILRYDCLERMYNKITTNKFDIISCLVETFGRENEKQEKINSTLHNFVWNCTIHISFLHRKEDFDEVGGFDSSFKEGSEDFDLFQRLMNVGKKPFIIQDHLLLYRKHQNSRSDFIVANKKRDLELRFKLIANSPKLYHIYIEDVRFSLRKERKMIRKLLIILTISIISNIIQIVL